MPGGSVVVITGASSGIGRAAALEFARAGADLSLVARSEQGLAAVAEECRLLGAAPILHAVDVTAPGALDDVCARTVEAFGRIDVWVNCAAVLLLGRFEDIPAGSFERVIAINVLGYASGARAALEQFHAQGDRGILINVGSVLGLASEPYASAYIASKFAIRGLTSCLRQELRDFPNIHVCAVLPAALDTPIYQHAGNFMAKKARSIVPVYDPLRAAKAIVRLSRQPRRQVVIGAMGHLIALGTSIAPGLTETLIGRFGPKLQFESTASPESKGNLFAPREPQRTEGGWRAYWRSRLFGWR